MFGQACKRAPLAVAVAVLVLALNCCGSREEGSGGSTVATDSQTAEKPPSAKAAQMALAAAHRWAPGWPGFGGVWKREGSELASTLMGFCDLEEKFWNAAAGRAASPLIGRGENTFLAEVGVFRTRNAAVRAFRSLWVRSQRACYVSLIHELFVRQIGPRAVTPSRVVGIARRASAARALEVGTELHYPAGSYKGKRYPARDLRSDARIGLLRKGSTVYLVSSFRWGDFSPDPLNVIDRISA